LLFTVTAIFIYRRDPNHIFHKDLCVQDGDSISVEGEYYLLRAAAENDACSCATTRSLPTRNPMEQVFLRGEIEFPTLSCKDNPGNAGNPLAATKWKPATSNKSAPKPSPCGTLDEVRWRRPTSYDTYPIPMSYNNVPTVLAPSLPYAGLAIPLCGLPGDISSLQTCSKGWG
jgi:hypothetical protein